MIMETCLRGAMIIHKSSTHAFNDKFLVSASVSPEINKVTSIWHGKIVTIASSSSSNLEEINLSMVTSLKICLADWSLNDLPLLSSTLVITKPEVNTITPSAWWNTHHWSLAGSWLSNVQTVVMLFTKLESPFCSFILSFSKSDSVAFAIFVTSYISVVTWSSSILNQGKILGSWSFSSGNFSFLLE